MIIRYQKRLATVPESVHLSGYSVRAYEQESDQAAWIAIHQRAFGHEKAWARSRFVREFMQKVWWEPRRMLFAVESATGVPVGTITLGETQSAGVPVGTVSWLAVEPGHRGIGLGRLLVSRAELLAISIGYASLELETLSDWEAANRLYRAMGWGLIAISNGSATHKNEPKADG